jgi:ankyrin repeat protein
MYTLLTRLFLVHKTFQTEIPPLIQTVVSPQSFLEKMMQARGYSTASFRSVDGGYYCKPTSLQVASYGVKIIQAIRTSDGDLLKRMLDCSISPNACNAFGESAVHMVCRRGHHKLLKILVDAGCSLQVADDFGRTPLHDACWTVEPSFDCVELILNADSRLLNIVDCRGSPPLSYIRREHWKQWIEFLESKADWYWPPRDVSTEGEEAPPPLVGVPPHSRPIPDPKNAIPVDMAALISSGKLDPEDFLRRQAEAPEIKQVATQALVADASK